MNTFAVKKATIASGQSLSAEINVSGMVLIGISMPAAWTAAGITFQGGISEAAGQTLQDLYDEDGAEIAWTGAAAGRYLIGAGAAPPMTGLAYLKVRSGTAGVPVAQGAERVITLIFDRS